MNKYTIRKLVFILILMGLIAAPFGIQEYKSMTTTDPYILMARKIEAFSEGDVDVVDVEDHPSLDSLLVITNILDYSTWSDRIKENFQRHVMFIVRDYDYDNVVIAIGWGAPAETVLLQREFICTNLRVTRADACSEIVFPGVPLLPQYNKWPGIGKP